MGRKGTGWACADRYDLSLVSHPDRTKWLAGASVFIDFDGTISLTDTGIHLMERLAPPRWHDIERLYESGDIGSRECTRREWAMLPRDRALIESIAGDVPIDPATGPLVRRLRAAGAEVTIVSDGFGVRPSGVAEALGLPIVTNEVDWDTFEIVFPDNSACGVCSTCGTCKRLPLESALERGRTTVLVGDGTSDRRAAEIADVVYAKDELARWCTSNDIPHRPYATLRDVLSDLEAAQEFV